jgi:ribosome-binding factor A
VRSGRKRQAGGRDVARDRRKRVAEEIRMKAAELLQRELSDPRLAGVHLTRVELSRDHSWAKLYYRTLPGAATVEQAKDGAPGAARFLRSRLGRSLHLRTTPEIQLLHDEVPDEAARLEDLLASIAHGEDEPVASDGDGAAAVDDESE